MTKLLQSTTWPPWDSKKTWQSCKLIPRLGPDARCLDGPYVGKSVDQRLRVPQQLEGAAGNMADEVHTFRWAVITL